MLKLQFECRFAKSKLKVFGRQVCRTVLILISAMLFVTGTVYAGPLDGVANITLGAFLDRVQKTADNTVINAANQGNGLVTHAADEANVFATNLRLDYSDSLDKTIGALDLQQQTVVAKLLGMEQHLNDLMGRAYDWKDTTLLDIANLEQGLPLTHVADFYVQRIDGVSYLQHGGDYSLVLYAHGVGISSDTKTTITATLNGHPVQFAQDPDQTTLGKAVLHIKNDSLQPLFTETSLVTPKLVINVQIHKSGWFGTNLFSSTKSYSVPVYVNLYPRLAAKAVLHVIAPKYGWVSVGTEYGSEITVPDKDGCRNEACEAHNTVTVSVAGPTAGPPTVGSRRIVRLDLDCTSRNSICNFVDSVAKVTSQNGTRGIITFNTNSHSVNFRADAAVEEWQQIGTTSADVPVQIEFQQQAAAAVDDRASLITMDVTTFSGNKYSIPVQGPDNTGLISYVSRTKDVPAPGEDTILLTASPPI